jgi:hypothetical protein
LDNGKTGTEYVKQAATFFGRDQWFEEWADMDVRSEHEIAIDRRWEALQERATPHGLVVNRAARFESEQERVNTVEREALNRRFERAGMNGPKFQVVK